METIVITFYEKPGCLTNRRQKALLEEAGYVLRLENLLTQPWTPETLRPFFTTLPVAAWFNPSAPAIKAGTVDPSQLSESQALAALIADPILIRRPLLNVEDRYMAGFDREQLQRLGIFLPEEEDKTLPDSCSKSNSAPVCPVPATNTITVG